MRKLGWVAFIVVLAGVIAVAAAASRSATPKAIGKVLATPTGDTLLVKIGKAKAVRVRILGVRAPTASDCYGTSATAATRALTLNQRVTLVGNLKTGAAFVSLPNGDDLGQLLVARGVAQMDIWSARTTREQVYAAAQREAERTFQGMWGACSTDVEVSISGPDSGFPGQLLSYSVVVQNVGPLVARDVELRLRPGNYSEFVQRVTTTDATCTRAEWMATCAMNALAPGATANVTLVLYARNFGALSARAEATMLGCIRERCGDAPLLDRNLNSNHASAVTILPGGGYERKCDPSYPSACIPVPPPDLDCEDFLPLKNFPVRHDVAAPDDHHLDGNHDGVGCQEEDY